MRHWTIGDQVVAALVGFCLAFAVTFVTLGATLGAGQRASSALGVAGRGVAPRGGFGSPAPGGQWL